MLQDSACSLVDKALPDRAGAKKILFMCGNQKNVVESELRSLTSSKVLSGSGLVEAGQR